MEVYPSQIVDYKALCGDSSDNIPGIRGIGPKTAVSLLSEYKTLDGVYENIENITKKAVKEKLIQGKEDAYLSQFLATIVQDLDLEFVFEGACLTIPNKENVVQFFSKMQFYSFVKNIDKLLAPFNSEKSCENIVQFAPIEENMQLGLFGNIVEEKKELKQVEYKNFDYLKEIKNGDKIGFLIDFQEKDYCYIAHNNAVIKASVNEVQDIILKTLILKLKE